MTETPTQPPQGPFYIDRTPERVRAAQTPRDMEWAARVVRMSQTAEGRLSMTHEDFMDLSIAQMMCATAYLEHAEEIARLRKRVEAADRLADAIGRQTLNGKPKMAPCAAYALAAYRATEKQG